MLGAARARERRHAGRSRRSFGEIVLRVAVASDPHKTTTTTTRSRTRRTRARRGRGGGDRGGGGGRRHRRDTHDDDRDSSSPWRGARSGLPFRPAWPIFRRHRPVAARRRAVAGSFAAAAPREVKAPATRSSWMDAAAARSPRFRNSVSLAPHLGAAAATEPATTTAQRRAATGTMGSEDGPFGTGRHARARANARTTTTTPSAAPTTARPPRTLSPPASSASAPTAATAAASCAAEKPESTTSGTLPCNVM